MVQASKTRVLAAEELVASKVFVARRERFDGADIAHVIYGTRGKLDWQRILRMVGEHWEICSGSLCFFAMCIRHKHTMFRKESGVTFFAAFRTLFPIPTRPRISRQPGR